MYKDYDEEFVILNLVREAAVGASRKVVYYVCSFRVGRKKALQKQVEPPRDCCVKA